MSMLQHVMPQYYLRGFCDPVPSPRQGPVVWEYRLGDATVGRHAPKNVGRLADYYPIPAASGTPNQAIERALSKVETDAAPLFAKLRRRDFRISSEERSRLAAFVAVQIVRGPAFRDHVQATVGEAGTIALRTLARRGALPAIATDASPEIAERLREIANAPEKYIEVRGTPAASLKALAIAPELARHVFALRWAFLLAEGKTHFVTSDTPITLRHLERGRPAGFAIEGTEMTFPISADICLCARRTEAHEPTGAVTTSDEAVFAVNLERVRHAQWFVAGNSREAVEWAKQRYLEFRAAGTAHARSYRTVMLDGTGDRLVGSVVKTPFRTPDERERPPE